MAPKRDRVLNDFGYLHGLTNNPIFLLHGFLAAIITILIAASTVQAKSTLTIAVVADRQHGGFADGKPAARLGGDALAHRHHRAPINGACGSANGVAVNSAPTSGRAVLVLLLLLAVVVLGIGPAPDQMAANRNVYGAITAEWRRRSLATRSGCERELADGWDAFGRRHPESDCGVRDGQPSWVWSG
jgi:hypothetical protein